MTRIFIEGYELDINKGLSNQITYAIDDLKNVDSKSTAFTKTIILPGTANNNNLLGNIFEFNNGNFTNDLLANVGYNYNASKGAKCLLQSDGMTLIKGVFKLNKIVKIGKNIEYECSIIGELGGFAFKLAALKLQDLDFSAYNHTWDTTNIINSWANDNAGSGYVYPLIDYGIYSVGKIDYSIGTFRPALFAKEYLHKIITNAGYTYECDLFNTDRFKRLIVPHNKKTLTQTGTKLARCSPVFSTAQNIPTELDLNGLTGAGWSVTALGTNDRLTYTAATTLKTNITFYATGTLSTIYNPSDGVIFYVLKNGVKIIDSAQFVNGWSADVPFIFDYYLENETVATNDFYQIRVEPDGPVPMTPDTITCQTGFIQVDNTVPTVVDVQISDLLNVNDCIPQNILQKDFFTSILKLFNLYVDENRHDEKHLIIKPYVDYFDGTILDWSDKLDRGAPITIAPMSELNARYYNFKFKSDSDFYNEQYRKRYNEGYGDRIYDTAYEFAKDSQDIEVIFSATVLVGYTGKDKITSTILKQTGTGADIIEENTDSNIRILQCRTISGIDDWHIRNVANTGNLSAKLNSYLFAGHFDQPVPNNDLNFGIPKELFFNPSTGVLNVNQFNVYYSSYMAEITNKDSRLLTVNLHLNNIDIYNLSFKNFIYIDGGLYRLSKLIDYTPESNDTTKAELLRVINKEY